MASEENSASYWACSLHALNQSSEIFVNKNAYNAFIQLINIIRFKTYDLKELIVNNFEEFISNLLTHMFTLRGELDFSVNIDRVFNDSFYEAALALTDLNERRILVFACLLWSTNQLFRSSNEFCSKFLLKQGAKAFLLYISDESFVNQNKNVKLNDFTANQSDPIEYMTLNISILSAKTCAEYKHVWLELDVVQPLLRIAKLNESKMLRAYSALSYILDDTLIEGLAEIHSVIDTISKYLNKCKKDFKADRFFRLKQQIVLRSGMQLDGLVHFAKIDNSETLSGIHGLLECLFNLSVNDKLKSDIYFKNGMKSCLKTILQKGRSLFFTRLLSKVFNIYRDSDKEIDMWTT